MDVRRASAVGRWAQGAKAVSAVFARPLAKKTWKMRSRPYRPRRVVSNAVLVTAKFR
jgi:hypothetical protein